MKDCNLKHRFKNYDRFTVSVIRIGTWSFCGQIVKISSFSEVVCAQIFFGFFWVFFKIWPNFA